ncbi:MAG: hypothetical protein RBT25_10215 [Lentisphaeria bacterium]|nr:hypothetical protein [Lentisphaeria bacterium]
MLSRQMFLFVLLLSILAPAAEPILRCDFEQWGHGWYTPPYYGGETAVGKDRNLARNGLGFLHIKATPSDKETYGRAIIHPKLDFWAGKIIGMQGHVKGRGEFLPGFAFVVRKAGKKENMLRYADAALTLTSQYQQFSFILDLSQIAALECTPRLELRGAGEAFIDDLIIEELMSESPLLTAASPPPPISVGELPAKLDFRCSEPGMTVRFFRMAPDGELIDEALIVSAQNGLLNYLPTEKADSRQIGINQVVAALAGATARVQYEVKEQ